MPKFNADFSDVGEGFTLPAEGTQICKVKSVELKDGQKAKYLNWTLVIGTGPDKGSQIFHITSLSPNALFNLRNTLIACGQDVPKSKFQVNTDLCIGKIVGIDVVHQSYEKDGVKKMSAKVKEIFPVVRGESGWVRADQAAKDVVENNTPAAQPAAEEASFDEMADEIDI